MAVDYDLVIIGSTPLGMYAAETAISLQARVALVTQITDNRHDSQSIFESGLNEISRWIGQNRDNPWEIDVENPSSRDFFETIRKWQKVTTGLNSTNSLKTLAALGVDVIFDRGEFCRLPKLAFVLSNRKLRSRSYLLTTGSQYTVPLIESSSSVNCLTYSDLCCQEDLLELPQNLVAVGNSFQTYQLVQNLTRLGHKILLLISESNILPQEDLELAIASSRSIRSRRSQDFD